MNHEDIILPDDVADFVSRKKIHVGFEMYMRSICEYFSDATCCIELLACVEDCDEYICIIISSEYTREEFNLTRKLFYKLSCASEYSEYFSIIRR